MNVLHPQRQPASTASRRDSTNQQGVALQHGKGSKTCWLHCGLLWQPTFDRGSPWQLRASLATLRLSSNDWSRVLTMPDAAFKIWFPSANVFLSNSAFVGPDLVWRQRGMHLLEPADLLTANADIDPSKPELTILAASSSLVRSLVCACALRSVQTTTIESSTTLALDGVQEGTCDSRNHQQVHRRVEKDLCARLDQLHQLHASDVARLLLKPYKLRDGVRVVSKADLVVHNHPCVVFREQVVCVDICVWSSPNGLCS